MDDELLIDLRSLLVLLRRLVVIFMVPFFASEVGAEMVSVTSVGHVCRNSEKLPLAKKVLLPNGGFRVMSGAEPEIPMVAWGVYKGGEPVRIDLDGDGVCDSIIVEPGGEGVGDSQEGDVRERIVFVHGEQVRRIKPNIPADTLKWSIP